MQSDDQFRVAFAEGTARLLAWAERQRDCAEIGIEESGTFWRLTAAPHVANACPVELILYRDSQTYDAQIGSEIYEGRSIETFEALEALLDAVVAGRVVTETTESAAGAVPLAVRTVVLADDMPAWVGVRGTTAAVRIPMADGITHSRHWLPYRRS